MPETSKLKVLTAFAAIYLIWGSTYLAIRFAVETMPPFLMAGMRFLVGGVFLYVLLRSLGARAPLRKHWRSAVILGLLMPVGGTGLVSWAETVVPSGLTALLVATTPMWIVLADWVRPRGTRPLPLIVVGLILGFAGIVLLINPADIGGFNEVDKLGAMVVVIAAASWAAGSICSRHVEQPDSKLVAVGMQMVTGGVALILVSALTGELVGFSFVNVSVKSWLSLGYLTSLGSAAFAAYLWLLTVSTPARAATYAYVNPVVALVLGAMLAGEALSLWALGCAAVVIVAVVIIISAKAAAAPPVIAVTPRDTVECVDEVY